MTEINSRKNKSLALIGLMGFVLLISHQNCAPTEFSDTESMDSGSSSRIQPINQAPLPVTTIDNARAAADVSFQYKEVVVQPNVNEIGLEGICDPSQEGVTLGWKLHELQSDGNTGFELGSGFAICSRGSFTVQMSVAEKHLDCSHRYKVTARLGFGRAASSVLSRLCGSAAN